MANQRLHWVDIAKGMLILLVVLHHLAGIAIREGQTSDWINRFGDGPSFLYMCFFMPAFFFLTGYTSNFQKPFKPFLVSNAKGLLVPFVSFQLLTTLLQGVIYQRSELLTPVGGGQQVPFILEGLWFLPALFISKVLYWGLIRVCRDVSLHAIICILLIVVVVATNSHYGGNSDAYNYLHYRNALALTFFLWLGRFYREHQASMRRFWLLLAGLYLPAIAVLKVMGIFPPYYTHTTELTYATIPLWLFHATSGIMLTVAACQWLNENKFPQFRNHR